ncbi:MAG: 50S ribosomal protein L7ae [Methanophagales archaeon ANME-1-THS]|nr:MAG: 50S ribosomal protein L7ae [Methanophagales archaeon ANME-1-THS]
MSGKEGKEKAKEKRPSVPATLDIPEDLQRKSLEAVELARTTGTLKKGTNETTKTIERGLAKLVVISKDVTPEEIALHLPPLCDEKGIPYVHVKSQKDLGAACGINKGCASAAIVDPGKAADVIQEIVEELKKLKG